jgi:hypothetical protein
VDRMTDKATLNASVRLPSGVVETAMMNALMSLVGVPALNPDPSEDGTRPLYQPHVLSRFPADHAACECR